MTRIEGPRVLNKTPQLGDNDNISVPGFKKSTCEVRVEQGLQHFSYNYIVGYVNHPTAFII